MENAWDETVFELNVAVNDLKELIDKRRERNAEAEKELLDALESAVKSLYFSVSRHIRHDIKNLDIQEYCYILRRNREQLEQQGTRVRMALSDSGELEAAIMRCTRCIDELCGALEDTMFTRRAVSASPPPPSEPVPPGCGQIPCGSEWKPSTPPRAYCAPPSPPKAAPAPAPKPTPPAPAPESKSVPKDAAPAPAIGAAIMGSIGLFAGLLGKKPEKKALPLSPRVDDVQFRAAAPGSIIPGRYFNVKIMMYLDGDHARADREQQSLGDKIKAASSSIFKAKKNQQFRIVLQSPDTPLEDCSETLVWNGKYASTDMEVLLPQDYDKPQLRLRGRVYSGNAALTDLKLILEVNAAKGQNVDCEKCELRSAFISYASQDREKVVARIQGIQLACPDMDLFFDVENLRRGEHWQPRLFSEISKRDLFYLFWSRNAAQSEWVAKELAFALANKNTDYIEPIPLESPEVCPPPAALNDRHFNDWTLRYLNK